MDKNEENETVYCIPDYWILFIFISFESPQMTILAPFGGPWAPFGHHFAIKWVTDAHRGTLEGPRVESS